MKSKILFSIIFLTFLISSVFAVTIDVDYADFSTLKTITNGQSIDVYVDGGSMNPSTLITVKINSKTIYQENVSSTGISKVYTITPSMYANSVGTYTITVTATDGLNTDSGEVTLTVKSSSGGGDDDDENNAPVLASIGNKNVNESQLLQFKISATDKDNDSLSFIASGLPSGASFNENTKTFSWTPTSSQVGSYFVVFTVSDGDKTDYEQIKITVKDINSDSVPPVITLLGNGSITVEQGSTYTDAGATATDNVDGNLTSKIRTSNPVNPNVLGTYTVTYTVSDLAGNTDTETRTVNVINSTIPDTTSPSVEITSPTNKTYYYKSKKPMDFAFTISDANLQSCWYNLNDEANVSFSCSLDELENINVKTGENNLTIYANDSAGNIGSDSVTFNYKKKSSSSGGSGSGSSTTIISPIIDTATSTGNVVIPITQTIEEKENYLPLYCFMIATTSLGIIILSIILSRKLKEIKKNKNLINKNKIQEQPHY
ncbi:DUF5011 domain-containing protein [Candidatus Pacearchaeota archaeon]|jgi:hypothetical protein|nr:DUF5011 domain-containing protein [Candidatus Pacearchaeota archaeon]